MVGFNHPTDSSCLNPRPSPLPIFASWTLSDPQVMNVEGMTRENIASHLQKYRMYLKRLAGIPGNDPIPAHILSQVSMRPHPARVL